ncbi:MAG: hypothetical protein RBR05_02245 [Candidatus Methanomethylophilaceae archaeon]|nr:hypothetical protein [Candidatus Methanomethylophilaceae archaeon]MDY0224205.1 hypothetical protein [Candidatus Methanomethylophilaceae archaeon]
MDEFNVMEELGLTHDKQLICSCQGFLQMNNSSKGLCERFIKNGDKFYDIISRYDDIIAYVLNRDEGRSGNTARFIAPFLKAFGATDYGMYQYCKESLRIMPEAKRVMKYLTNTLPTFISTSSYEHNVMALCDTLDISINIVDRATVSMDSYDISRSEGRLIREMANQVTNLKLPRHEYELNVPMTLEADEIHMIEVCDEIFHNKIKDLEINELMRNMKVVGANEKAYSLLDIRKRTMIDLDGTAYIGGAMMDYQSMDLVRDGGGLSMAFNGSEFAVHGCNIAVLSRDCTVAAVLVQEFYNEGIEAVYELVRNWDREKLKNRECPDRYLMDAMLAANPHKLPEVYIVDKDNVKEIAKKSNGYRKKLFSQKNY